MTSITTSITAQERDQAALYLNQTRNGLVGAIKGLSDAQWTFTPSPDRWSIAQNVEHLVFILERVCGPMKERLAQAPPPPADRDVQRIDAIILAEFPNRLTKYPAPEFAYPASRFRSSAEAIPAVLKVHADISHYLESAPDLREHALEALPLKAVTKGAYDLMDGYQWILAATAHAERHTKQILEVRSDGRFPAN